MADISRRRALRSSLAAATALAGCVVPPAAERPADGGVEGWPEFRRDRRNTGHAAGAGDLGGDPTVAWTFETGGDVWGSPVVGDGTVYVGSADGRLYALDAAIGEEIWRRPTGGRIESTPALDGDTVYVGSYDRNVYALDAGTGEERWVRDVGAPVRGSPTVVDGTVYLGVGCHNLACARHVEDPPVAGWIYALDAATGETRWRHGAEKEVVSTPAVASGTVYAGSSDGRVYALAARSGAVEWTYGIGDWVWTSPSVVDGTVYFAGWDARVYAVDADTGDEVWTFRTVGDYVSGSTAVDGETVYVGNTPVRGSEPVEAPGAKVYGLDRRTGSERWSHETDAAEIGSSPAVSGGRVYVGSHSQSPDADGTGVYALDTRGRRRWFFDVGGRGVGSSPALVDGVLYFGAANGRVYALE